jgi:hypothetical protein
MIGDLMQTAKCYESQAPTECINGHQLAPERTLIGHHPPRSVLAGAARVR